MFRFLGTILIWLSVISSKAFPIRVTLFEPPRAISAKPLELLEDIFIISIAKEIDVPLILLSIWRMSLCLPLSTYPGSSQFAVKSKIWSIPELSEKIKVSLLKPPQ